ncbi:MAG: HAMP domain-containing histidine kinase [Bacteroidales bacterium]|jgi:signal transduction histidine kinase|nr:HAMP domain-containing histidine kinase [Bacteroidales bacterium]
MKLLQYTSYKFAVLLLFFIGTWGILFYFAMRNEIIDETDDMLKGYRDIFIKKALNDASLLNTTYETTFDRYSIRLLSREEASHYRESWHNEEMYFLEGNEHIPVRVFKSMFLASDDQYYELEVQMSTIERDDMAETLIFYLTGLFIALLICIFIGNRIILKRSFAPLKKLLSWLNSIVPGKSIPPLNNHTKIMEFSRLNEAALAMSQRNLQVYEQQKQFIENASHELQTPLAIALNKIELLSQNEEISEKQSSELYEIYNSLNQIVRLNKSLLLLSRIENGQFQENDEVNINALVDDTAQNFMEIYDCKGIKFTIANDEKCNVVMNKMLSKILISNILKNAFIHVPNNGYISASIERDKLVVKNSGEKPLDKMKIFERYYQTSEEKEDSTGLGLSITRSICRLYKFELSYDFYEGHIFTIKFK